MIEKQVAEDTKEIKAPGPAAPEGLPSENAAAPDPAPKKRKHWIRHAWVRIPLKVLMWIIIVVILIPVLLYIPPVQDFAIDIAKK